VSKTIELLFAVPVLIVGLVWTIDVLIKFCGDAAGLLSCDESVTNQPKGDAMGKQAIGPNQEKWLQALESGEYRQGQNRLVEFDESGMKCCCLGVGALQFCESHRRDCDRLIFGEDEGEFSTGTAPPAVIRALALRGPCGDFDGGCNSLVGMNDKGVTFANIAAFCRANPEAVFTEPR